MKKHVRLQGARFSFRLRALDRYVDAGRSFDTEEDAAFAADLAKHYLRDFFCLDLTRSLDGEVFAMLAHRHDVALPNRISVEQNLAPGVTAFLKENWDRLQEYKLAHEVEPRDWETLRGYDNEAIQKWVYQCDCADQVAREYATVNSDSFFLRLGVVERTLETAINSLKLARRMHGDTPAPALFLRCEEIDRLRSSLECALSDARTVYTRLKAEQTSAETALGSLEANRPLLT